MSNTYNQVVIARIVEPFRKEHGDGDFSLDEMTVWAIQKKLWAPTMKTQMALLRAEISEAMQSARREYNGLKVRQYHCVQRRLDSGGVQTLWSHIDVATPEFMEQSFGRRRQSEANRCYQLHSDIIYWNEKKNPGKPLEVLFDFRDDIADRDHARESGEDFPGDDSQDLD
jgi:hypothetical protein